MTLTLDTLASLAAGAAARLADPALFAPLLPALEAQAVAGVRANFDQATAPDGSPWPPLRRGNRKPLVKTGALRASIQARGAEEGVVVFSPLPYAGYQDRGTRTIPARPFLGLSQAALDGMAAAVADFAAGAVWGG